MQLHAGFTFADAAALVPQLADLCVTHLYLSPVLAHTPGSMHGYDVVDHARVDDELGGRPGLEQLAAAVHDAGLGLLVDIVPNHMSVAAPEDLNRAWWSVLSDGPTASTAHWFDIDWAAGDGRVVLPILGSDAALTSDGDVMRYHDHVLPLDDSHYKLAPWREAPTYRRFFDVTSLAALRVENADVFHATHALLLELLETGVVDGFRIDHPDGLADPRGYLERLAAATRGAWTVVEKILEPDEHLPVDWACAGTTGYDALRLLDGVLLDPAGRAPLTALWAEIDAGSWQQTVEGSKRLVLDQVLRPELERLRRRLEPRVLRAALFELIVAMPVYRTYLEDEHDPRPQDLAVLDRARDLVAQRRPDLSQAVSELVERLVTGSDRDLTTLFQQTTGPVMAKAVEDTAMYRWHRLTALNEVGGDPGEWGVSLAQWHEACERRQRREPLALTPLSTHDTKRSHDTRCRLIALAELAQPWSERLNPWMAALRQHGIPDPSIGYLMLQTLVAAWPLDEQRLGDFLQKAAREAKLHTSWLEPDDDYEASVRQGVRATLADDKLRESLAGFVARLTPAARRIALSAVALQLTMPGVPDTYQGGELEDLSLVDPDNRRAVDQTLRGRLIRELANLDLDEILDRVDEGLPKLALIKAGLRLRHRFPEAFGPDGGYVSIIATGQQADRVIAFCRGDSAVTVVPRFTVAIADWGNTALPLPSGQWRDVLTGVVQAGETSLAELLERFPVALLSRES